MVFLAVELAWDASLNRIPCIGPVIGSCLFGAQHGGMALPASIASTSAAPRSRPLKHWLARVANFACRRLRSI